MCVDLEKETSGARALGGTHEEPTDVSPAFGSNELLADFLDGVKRLQCSHGEATPGTDLLEKRRRRALLDGDTRHFVRIGTNGDQTRLTGAEGTVAEVADQGSHARRRAAARQGREVHRLAEPILQNALRFAELAADLIGVGTMKQRMCQRV